MAPLSRCPSLLISSVWGDTALQAHGTGHASAHVCAWRPLCCPLRGGRLWEFSQT